MDILNSSILKAIEKIAKIQTFNLFVIYLLVLIGTIIFSNNNVCSMIVIAVVFILLFIVKIVIQKNKLNDFTFFNIDEIEYKSDSQERAKQLGNLLAIMIILMFLIITLLTDHEDFDYKLIYLVLAIYTGTFFYALAYASITRKSIILPIITIFLSTIQGVLLLLAAVYIIFMSVSTIGINTLTNAPIDLVGTITSAFNGFDIGLFFVIFYLMETSAFTIPVMLITIYSIVLLVSFILFMPAYKLENLSIAFKIVNIIIAIISIFIFFFADLEWSNIKESLSQYLYNKYPSESNDIAQFLASFSKGTILNLGYIMLLPYTFGALLIGIIIELLKKKYQRKSARTLDHMLNLQDKSLAFKYQKQYVYYGGDKNLLQILNTVERYRQLHEKHCGRIRIR